MCALARAGKIDFLFVGDIMFNEEFLTPEHADESPEYYLSQFKDIFDASDLVVANLECVLFKSGSPIWPKSGFRLYSSPDKIMPMLRYMNANILSMSNNHVYDFGLEALRNTKTLLEQNGISSYGAGADELESRRPLIIESDGVRVGFLGYTIIRIDDTGNVQLATADRIDPENAAHRDYRRDIETDIRALGSKVDLVVVSLHWGFEYYQYPSPQQIDLAHAIIEAGANIMIGHHPHCVQGMEEYKGGIICYSLGNFFFCNHHRRREYPLYGNEFAAARVKYQAGKLLVDIITGQMDESNRMTRTPSYRKGRDRLADISLPLSDSNYVVFWQHYRKAANRLLRYTHMKNALRLAFTREYYTTVCRKVRKKGLLYAFNRVRHKLRNVQGIINPRR